MYAGSGGDCEKLKRQSPRLGPTRQAGVVSTRPSVSDGEICVADALVVVVVAKSVLNLSCSSSTTVSGPPSRTGSSGI